MVVYMADDQTPQDSPISDSTFESEMRRQRELMKGMATRESWDAESRWIIQGRRIAAGALVATAILGLVLILWIASSLFLGS
jgi:hypothetical protein